MQDDLQIMSKIFVNIGLSLDGYMAPEGMTMENFEYKGTGFWMVHTPHTCATFASESVKAENNFPTRCRRWTLRSQELHACCCDSRG